MKLQRGMLVGTAMLFGALTASGALAGRGGGGHSGGHGGGHGGGHSGHFASHFVGGSHFSPQFRTSVFIGATLAAPFYYYYPPPYYYYPDPAVGPSAPTYVEQYSGQIAPPQSSYWYYCSSSNAYYPYVRDCPGGWQQVAPRPPS